MSMINPMSMINSLLNRQNRMQYQEGGEVPEDEETGQSRPYSSADYNAMAREWKKLEESQGFLGPLSWMGQGAPSTSSPRSSKTSFDSLRERYHAMAPWRFQKKHNIPFLGTIPQMTKWLQMNEGTYRSSRAERNEENWDDFNLLDGLL